MSKIKKENKSEIPSEEVSEEEMQPTSTEPDLIPKAPSKLAPRGIRTFTVFRENDETGVSGDSVVIEGAELATGQCIIHWLYPPPRGGIAIFESMDDFIKVHIAPHPANNTIITFQDGDQLKFGDKNKEEEEENENS